MIHPIVRASTGVRQPTLRPRTGRRSGQATAEFGLVVSVLVLLMMGVVDFGRLVAMQAAVVTASREAARYGSAVGPAAGSSPTEPQYVYCTGIRDAARRVVSGVVTLTDSTIAITYDNGANPPTSKGACPATGEGGPADNAIDSFDRVVVSVSATYAPISPVRFLVPSINVVSIDRRAIVKGP